MCGGCSVDGNVDVDFEDGFALSLVPVAVGYAIAHYIGMAVFEGQQLLIQLSDPLDQGWNLLVRPMITWIIESLARQQWLPSKAG